jgi:hypothetical protein
MNLLLGFTDQPKQQTTIVTADGTPATLLLEYKPNQLGWFYDLTWGNFTVLGQRLPSSPNALRQFRNQINWGLAVISKDNVEPTTQEVFVDGTTQLYLLDEADVALVESTVYPGLSA